MLATLIVIAGLTTAAPATTPDPLQPLRFLVGHCWSGDLPNGMGRDTHCFEPMYGERFVHDRHVVKGKGADYLGETIYGFDPKQKRIVFWYWSSSGVIESGAVEAADDGLNFPEHHLTQPQELIYRTHWKHVADDRYEALNERKGADSTWQTEWKVEYVLEGAAP